MNQWALIGQRGVGKSSLLQKLQERYREFVCISLDTQIQNSQNRSIHEIFATEGEEGFRVIERSALADLIRELGDQKFIIDIGAGFIGDIPKKINCLWLQRAGHGEHSLSIDRPPLDGGIAIRTSRYQERQNRYRARADLTLQLRDGPDFFQDGEVVFFDALLKGKEQNLLSDYYYTIHPQSTGLDKQVLKQLGVKGFEFRDDWVSPTDSGQNPASADLISLRVQKPTQDPSCSVWDWPLEWGDNNQAPILSLHQREKKLTPTLGNLPETQQIIKLAIAIENFTELIEAHRWAQQDPQRRAFLPMSQQGRWNWYRQWMATSSPVNFLRLAEGSAPDQPSVLQILNSPKERKYFAAVIGSPVQHSWTPTFHQKFFRQRQAPVFSIDVQPEEWTEALPFLQELGLRWAAVTSPLKQAAADLVKAREPLNTLVFSNAGWEGANTDEEGLRQLLAGTSSQAIAVWGGGGTLPSILQCRPDASCYSSRTGLLKKGTDKPPQILIWAVGRQKFRDQGQFPPRNWPVQRVLDLNYGSDSPGMECAWNYGCQYTSGMVMFEAQALKQQEFWNERRFE